MGHSGDAAAAAAAAAAMSLSRVRLKSYLLEQQDAQNVGGSGGIL